MNESKPKGWHERVPKPAWVPAALAALAASVALNAGVLALFDSAAPGRWPGASPALEAALAKCRALPARELPPRCARDAVAAAAQPASAVLQVAAGPP
jgi:hypothetical protein